MLILGAIIYVFIMIVACGICCYKAEEDYDKEYLYGIGIICICCAILGPIAFGMLHRLHKLLSKQ